MTLCHVRILRHASRLSCRGISFSSDNRNEMKEGERGIGEGRKRGVSREVGEKEGVEFGEGRELVIEYEYGCECVLRRSNGESYAIKIRHLLFFLGTYLFPYLPLFPSSPLFYLTSHAPLSLGVLKLG